MRLLRAPLAIVLSLSLPSLALARSPAQLPGQLLDQSLLAFAPADALSDEEKIEKAKGLYIEAERLAAEDNWEAAVVLYEQAYYLVPGKHGFAHKVGIAAWKVHDCDKAYDYLTHFLEYADPERQGDKMTEAQGILAEVEAQGCRTPEAEPEPDPDPDPVEPDEVEDPFATDPGPGPDDPKPKKKGGKGLLAGGAVLLTLGVGGVAVGGVGAAMASSAGSALDDLASTNTNTGYPIGDYACRGVTSDQCPVDLEGKLGTGKALTFAGFIGGGVLLVTGVALIVVHVTKNKKKPSASAEAKGGVELTSVGPTLLPGGGGAAATLRF